jgi:electron transfer flavoprotein beta subunit
MNAYTKFDNTDDYTSLRKPELEIPVLTMCDLAVDFNTIGLDGSPTRVKDIQNVVIKSEGSKEVPATKEAIADLLKELVKDHII